MVLEKGFQSYFKIETVIVVLHHNKREMTEECLNSIIKTTPAGKYHILVIDNASTIPFSDGPQFVNTTVIRREENKIVPAMNQGFLEALKFDCKYVVNFDNDVVCLEGWYEPLVTAMESDPSIGVVGGKQWDREQKIFRSVGWDLVGGIIYGNAPKWNTDVVWIQGSAVMMRTEMMRLIGVHDARFKTLCSDSDYCLHARVRGWRVRFISESNVIHYGNTSIDGVSPDWTDDNKLLLDKWSGKENAESIANFPLEMKNNKYLVVTYNVIQAETPKKEAFA